MRRSRSTSIRWDGKELKRLPDELLREGERHAVLDLSENPGLQLSSTDFSHLIDVRELAIRGCGLQQLPNELTYLRKLSFLDVSRNELASLPDCVWNFVQLKTLNVSENLLTSLPSVEQPQQALLTLDASKNKITALPRTIHYLGALKNLNLGYNLLDRLPDDIWRLSQMEVLIVRNNAFVQLPTRMWRQHALVTLDASNNMLTSLPRDLFQLPELEKLNIDGNVALAAIHVRLIFHERIRELTVDVPLRGSMTLSDLRSFNEDFTSHAEAVGRLKSSLELRLDTNELELSLHNRGLTTLGEYMKDIASLETLTALDVSKNDLEALPADLWSMTQVKSLNLFDNSRLLFIPPEVTALSHLQELNAGSCSLSALPTQLELLPHLACLRISSNPQLQGLPEVVFALGDSLVELDISACGLSSLPSKISTLHLLKELNVSTNELTELPAALGTLQNLEILRASNNNFSTFPQALLSLRSLATLDLSNNLLVSGHPYTNSIAELPINILSLSLLSRLDLSRNPMRVPPSAVCDQGIPAVRAYLADASAGRARLCVATFSLVGETGAGKTSLMCSLERGAPYLTTAEDRTRVMDQRRMSLLSTPSGIGDVGERVEGDDGAGVAVFNDFGGHTIYQTVLPVLLPPGGVVVIVYDVTSSNPEGTVDKWLTTTLALSPRTRVIVVGTHIDLLPPDNNCAAATVEADRMARFCRAKMATVLEELLDHERDARLDVDRCSELAEDYPATERVLNRKLNSLQQSLFDVRAAAAAAERWPPLVVSCSPRNGDELALLHCLRAVLIQAAPPPAVLPASWCRFIRDLLEPGTNGDAATSGVRQATYLTMSAVQAMFAVHFPSEIDRSKLGFILTYLAETSQVIWLQGHPRLSEVVFHRVDHVIDIFKAVLCHDDLCSWAGSGRYASDVAQYKNGFLTESLLHKLLEPHMSVDCRPGFLAELLVQFRIISLLDGSSRPRVYVIPSKLPEVPLAVAPLVPAPPSGCGDGQVRVHAQLVFFGSVVPLAFFETSLVIVLQHVEQLQPQPAAVAAATASKAICWRDGVCFRRNGVSVMCQRTRMDTVPNTFDIRVSSSNVRSLWSVLQPLLYDLTLYLATSWKGAFYELLFWCPACESRASPDAVATSTCNDAGRWRFDMDYATLEELLQCASGVAGYIFDIGLSNAGFAARPVVRRQIARRDATLGGNRLPLEQHRERKRPAGCLFCSSCGLDVPHCLLAVCWSDCITDDDVGLVAKFVSNLEGTVSGDAQVLYHTSIDKSVSYVLVKDLLRESEGVGMICCPELRATGFRIGSRYLITAKHVVEKMIPEKDKLLNYADNLLSSGDREVFVIFRYDKSFMTVQESTMLDTKRNLAVTRSQKQWQAAGLVTAAFSGSFVLLEGIDAAVLELRTVTCGCENGCEHCSSRTLPPPLSCAVSTLQVTSVESVHVIGHPDGKPKQLDVQCGIVKLSQDVQRTIGSGGRGQLGGRDGTLVLYECALYEGASGAPVLGVPCGAQRPVVIAMHVCGFPVTNSDAGFLNNSKRNAWKKQKVYQGGVRMDCILKCLKEHHSDIYDDITNKPGVPTNN